MDRIVIDSKVYCGDQVLSHKSDNREVAVYSLNIATDKFLALSSKNNSVKDFVITGADKVCQIEELLNGNTDEIEAQIAEGLSDIKRNCFVKKLRKIDKSKFRDMVTKYYDRNYPKFVVAGIKLEDIIKEAV